MSLNLDSKEMRLRKIGANLAVRFEEHYQMPAADRAQVFLEALDLCAYKHRLEHSSDYAEFAAAVLGELDRVKDLIEEAK